MKFYDLRARELNELLGGVLHNSRAFSREEAWKLYSHIETVKSYMYKHYRMELLYDSYKRV